MAGSEAKDRAFGALVGLAIGDAVGTTLEFMERDSHPPLTDMIGGGPFDLKAGEWTDDTSMALCLADALIEGDGKLDQRRLLSLFVDWWQLGRNSVTGVCFDIGNATRQALSRFRRDGSLVNNIDEDYQANGSIMRLAPVVLCASDRTQALVLALEQGETTHAASVPQDCCEALAGLLWDLVETGGLPAHFAGLRAVSRANVISSGHAPATLHAASWAVAQTTDFRSAVLLAANLGDDADTVAAVTGQIAGALYGLRGIEPAWLAKLAWREEILEKCDLLWSIRDRKAR